jgi:hypothetical protein
MKAFDRFVVITSLMVIWAASLLKLVSLTKNVGVQSIMVATLVFATLNAVHKITRSSKAAAYLGVGICTCLLPCAPIVSMGVTTTPDIVMSWVIDIAGVLGLVFTGQILDSILTGGVFDKDAQ